MGVGETVISIRNVSKLFGSARALDDVSLDLRRGEFFCLLGPSGCGKSTLLRCLAGFEAIDTGAIALDGADLTRLPPHRRPLNMMFQSYALFPHLSVAANIAYGLRFAGVPRRERGGRVEEMLRLVRLDGLADRYPAQLSGGQRQRVALARALARRPPVLLLDEPLGALDPSLREETGAELKEIQASLGSTFVMVTHDQDEALGLADRIGLMRAGRLEQVGAPRTLYEEPDTRFAATFLGTANILPGIVERRDGDRVILRHPSGVRLAGIARPGIRVGDPAAAAIRPEGLMLSLPDTGPDNRLVGSARDVTFLGGRSLLRLRQPDGTDLRVWLRPESGFAVPQPGDIVELGVPASAVRILP